MRFLTWLALACIGLTLLASLFSFLAFATRGLDKKPKPAVVKKLSNRF